MINALLKDGELETHLLISGSHVTGNFGCTASEVAAVFDQPQALSMIEMETHLDGSGESIGPAFAELVRKIGLFFAQHPPDISIASWRSL